MAYRAESNLCPVPQNTLLYSVVIPAHNEENNISFTVEELVQELRKEQFHLRLLWLMIIFRQYATCYPNLHQQFSEVNSS
jgi:hypothetical protein